MITTMLNIETYSRMTQQGESVCESEASYAQDESLDDSHVQSQVFMTPVSENPNTRGRLRNQRGVSAAAVASSAFRHTTSLDRSPHGQVRERAKSSSCIQCFKAIEDKSIQCKMCNGHCCIKCSKIPKEALSFMMSGNCPWICNHCQRSGLPTLQKINETLETIQDTTKFVF